MSARASRNNLPAELSSFIGRSRDKAKVRRLLSQSRLVTVTGAGGCGKTRLALQVARSLQDVYPDGVWLAELAGVTDPDALWHVVGAAIGVLDMSKQGLRLTLHRFLRSRRLLLVLDNCEHIAAVCSGLVAELLPACPNLSVLATSRAPLRVPGEVLWRVSPMSVPEAGQAGLRQLHEYEAPRLLEERGRALLPDMHFAEKEAELVAELCRKLDGMPLAIELAAARLRVLSIDQVIKGLDDRFSLLTGGSPLVERHQTLRGMIDLSFNLLSTDEQALWRRLSVFAGGFTLEAAEAVCGSEPLSRKSVLDALAGLVDNSIITTEPGFGQLRYRLLESVRHYGSERLREAGEFEATTIRHRDWYWAFARHAEAQWAGPDQLELLNKAEADFDNLQAAFNAALSQADENDAALEIAAGLQIFWSVRGRHLSEGRRWLATALGRRASTSGARAKALTWAGVLAYAQGDSKSGIPLLRAGVCLSREVGDPYLTAWATTRLARGLLYDGDFQSADPVSAEGIELARAVGDSALWSQALTFRAEVVWALGDYAQAGTLFEQSLAVPANPERDWHLSFSLIGLAMVAWRKGDTARALSLLVECVRIRRRLDNIGGLAIVLEVFGWIFAEMGQLTLAAQMLATTQAQYEEIDTQMPARYRPDHDRCVSRIRRGLPTKEFKDAWREGMLRERETAIELALVAADAATAQRPRSGPRLLSRREETVARLVAQGLTNRDIAQRLSVSERTAESHVEHIRNKLGFRSRSQIAAWVAEKSLLPS